MVIANHAGLLGSSGICVISVLLPLLALIILAASSVSQGSRVHFLLGEACLAAECRLQMYT